ncbi:dirigent protein 9-like [Cucumis melo]|uniref:Dirigent protein n=1 Tax=Cucumis melo TaxID=3656 RepID=A0A1S3B188_CUCME|nr:dirigent protein 9-like [Cucumis melo]
MANPTNPKFPLSLFFILTALSYSDSSTTILNQVAAPNPLDQVKTNLSFFMHNILGGSHPTARTVTGTIPNKAEPTAGLPFSKPRKTIFPIPGGVPLVAANRNSNGRGGITNNNNNNNQPFVTAGQLPSGAVLQHVMFGSLTTIDNELTEGEELGSGVMGRGQGFYFISSLDGSSHTVALTVILHRFDEDEEKKNEDTISFFGVHRRGSMESPIAVVGGTGKYENASGFAVIENLRRRENQYMTDGDDTIVHFRVYLSQ